MTEPPPGLTPEEWAEIEAWERLSDEAWAHIDWGADGYVRAGDPVFVAPKGHPGIARGDNPGS